MRVERYISVVQRRRVGLDESLLPVLPMVEPLFLIDTHMSFDERVHLFLLAYELPQGFTACEVGSYLGASTAFLAAAARLKGGHVHAVDTWQNDAMGIEHEEDTFHKFQENTRPFRDRITVHRGRAEDMHADVPAVDMLFIDADHTYDAVARNLADYAPKLAPGATLALHDYNYDSVRRAVADHYPPGQLTHVLLADTLQAFRLTVPEQ